MDCYKLDILNRAQKEIDDAFEYYGNIYLSVLQSFDEQLEEVYNRLENNPFFQFRYKSLRALPFRTFPYIVFFTIDEKEKTVYIYSVFNTYQSPEKYPKP